MAYGFRTYLQRVSVSIFKYIDHKRQNERGDFASLFGVFKQVKTLIYGTFSSSYFGKFDDTPEQLGSYVGTSSEGWYKFWTRAFWKPSPHLPPSVVWWNPINLLSVPFFLTHTLRELLFYVFKPPKAAPEKGGYEPWYVKNLRYPRYIIRALVAAFIMLPAVPLLAYYVGGASFATAFGLSLITSELIWYPFAKAGDALNYTVTGGGFWLFENAKDAWNYLSNIMRREKPYIRVTELTKIELNQLPRINPIKLQLARLTDELSHLRFRLKDRHASDLKIVRTLFETQHKLLASTHNAMVRHRNSDFKIYLELKQLIVRLIRTALLEQGQASETLLGYKALLSQLGAKIDDDRALDNLNLNLAKPACKELKLDGLKFLTNVIINIEKQFNDFDDELQTLWAQMRSHLSTRTLGPDADFAAEGAGAVVAKNHARGDDEKDFPDAPRRASEPSAPLLPTHAPPHARNYAGNAERTIETACDSLEHNLITTETPQGSQYGRGVPAPLAEREHLNSAGTRFVHKHGAALIAVTGSFVFAALGASLAYWAMTPNRQQLADILGPPLQDDSVVDDITVSLTTTESIKWAAASIAFFGFILWRSLAQTRPWLTESGSQTYKTLCDSLFPTQASSGAPRRRRVSSLAPALASDLALQPAAGSSSQPASRAPSPPLRTVEEEKNGASAAGPESEPAAMAGGGTTGPLLGRLGAEEAAPAAARTPSPPPAEAAAAAASTEPLPALIRRPSVGGGAAWPDPLQSVRYVGRGLDRVVTMDLNRVPRAQRGPEEADSPEAAAAAPRDPSSGRAALPPLPGSGRAAAHP